jgi:single-strand DNA-binding protein
MNGLNRFQALGNLGADPALRFTPAGTPVTTLSIGVNYPSKQADNTYENKVEWLRVDLFGKLAENACQYLTKGRQVFAEGFIRNSSTGEGDARKYFTNLVATDLKYLGNGGGGSQTADVESLVQEIAPF